MSSRLQSAEDATKAFTTKAARLEICRSKARDYSWEVLLKLVLHLFPWGSFSRVSVPGQSSSGPKTVE